MSLGEWRWFIFKSSSEVKIFNNLDSMEQINGIK